VVGASAAQVTGSRARSGVRAATFTRIARGAVAPNAKQAPGFPRRLFHFQCTGLRLGTAGAYVGCPPLV
ncbi:MAG: hypothetical protein KGS10_16235, partial [Chloroflexi bacterium]|nr:hypothetical protein [Chloroflexota bacterium]